MELRAWFLALLVPLAGCVTGRSYVVESARSAPPGTGFLRKTTAGGIKYVVFIPHHYDASKTWPTIVFLHGILEAGTDGLQHLTVGLGPAIRKREDTFPFIAIFPQSTGMWHADREPLVLETLDRTAAEYSVDPDRVCLTGISSGGEGTWIVGADFHGRFAALVPMCGYAATDRVPALTTVPIRVFHNALDPFVPVFNSTVMVDKINAAGGRATLTAPFIPLHDCWSAAYDDELFAWLLRQRRVHPATSPASAG